MNAAKTVNNSISQSNVASAALTESERIAILEERSRHAATKAELYKSQLVLFSALLATLGGLTIHLYNTHNATLNAIISESEQIRALMYELLQRIPAGA